MANVPWTPTPRPQPMPATPDPMSSIMRGIQFSDMLEQRKQRKEDQVKQRQRQQRVMQILGEPGKLNAKKIRELAAADPMMANEVASFAKGLQELELGERKMALEQYGATINVLGNISSALMQVPPEQRMQHFGRMLEPLAKNPATKHIAQSVADHFPNGNFSDQSLKVNVMRATGYAKNLEGHAKKLEHDRKAELENLQHKNKMELEKTRQSGAMSLAKEAQNLAKVRGQEARATAKVRQQGQIDLEKLRQSGKDIDKAKTDDGAPAEGKKSKARVDAIVKLKGNNKWNREQKIEQVMRMVPGLTFWAALHIVDPRNAPKKEDEEGNEIRTDNEGNPVDLGPFEQWVMEGSPSRIPNDLPGAKSTRKELPAGAPSLVGKRLRGAPQAAPAQRPRRKRIDTSTPRTPLDVPF